MATSGFYSMKSMKKILTKSFNQRILQMWRERSLSSYTLLKVNIRMDMQMDMLDVFIKESSVMLGIGKIQSLGVSCKCISRV